MTTWNHAFTLAFSVPGSKHENWEDALNDPTEKQAVIAALLRRAATLAGNEAEYREALEGFDTYEEG